MIYVLLLEHRKLYVGYSERPIGDRFIEHFNYRASKWTSMHQPVQVFEFHEGGKQDENELTLKMMEKYGWWNVRGGSWCQVDMQTCPKALLNRQGVQLPIPIKQDRVVSKKTIRKIESCSRCGRNSHTAIKCYAKRHIKGNELDTESSESEESSSSASSSCFRCGRKSHYVRDCVAKTHIQGHSL